MSLHVGQLVICINDVFSPCPYWRSSVSAFPRLKGIYTIRSIREAHGLVGLCFYEIVSPPRQFAEGFVEPAFNSKNFRPAKKTSIEVFEKLLRPADPPASQKWVDWPEDVTLAPVD
jgi:hypothetical protein